MSISLFVDGHNFHCMQRDCLHWRVDPRKIISWLTDTRGKVLDAFYYTSVDLQNMSLDGFHKALPGMGYSVVSKEVKAYTEENGVTIRKANFDVEIAVDMLTCTARSDVVALVSGDGDFRYALSVLRSRGKQVMVIATSGVVARDLRDFAGPHYVDFRDIRSEVERHF